MIAALLLVPAVSVSCRLWRSLLLLCGVGACGCSRQVSCRCWPCQGCLGARRQQRPQAWVLLKEEYLLLVQVSARVRLTGGVGYKLCGKLPGFLSYVFFVLFNVCVHPEVRAGLQDVSGTVQLCLARRCYRALAAFAIKAVFVFMTAH